MSNFLVFLDHQHSGKPNKWKDTGASNGNNNEIDLTWKYMFYARKALQDLGVDVCILADGRYSERHNRVNEYMNDPKNKRKAIYVSCHTNAGSGNYGAVFYDYRSKTGKALSMRITAFLQHLEGLKISKAIQSEETGWTKHAYNTISGVKKPTAICYEPFFIRCADHRRYLTEDGLEEIGKALAYGISKFWGLL